MMIICEGVALQRALILARQLPRNEELWKGHRLANRTKRAFWKDTLVLVGQLLRSKGSWREGQAWRMGWRLF